MRNNECGMRKCKAFDEVNIATRRWASPSLTTSNLRFQHSEFRIFKLYLCPKIEPGLLCGWRTSFLLRLVDDLVDLSVIRFM